ncbi:MULTISPECIES: hypothetical protein [Nocardioides]|uniref:hypothetical protein n=1 Tax=Nocardioides TaxID=1839 RepID=UPI00033074AE|nr:MULTISPECIES: hypothetical protein [Nocardioides]EON23468.1 hypothetical protein CF8_2592 [Nocardioides sp. CF8]
MNMTSIRRAAMIAVGTTAAIALGAGSASAHHCFVPMYSLNGPVSDNWFVLSAQDAAADPDIAGFEAACPEAAEAGYAALRAADLPVGLKLFGKMTIGDPKGEERIPSNNGADGKGLEYFGAGSTVPFQMLDTWIGAAAAYTC